MPTAVPAEVRAFHDDCLVIDLHCDVLLNETLLGYDPARLHRNRVPGSPWLWHTDIPRLKAGGVGGVAMGIVVNPLRRGSALRASLSGLDRMAAWQRLAPGDVALASSAADIVAARTAGKVALFAGLEGAHGLGGRLDPLPDMRRRGLRYVGLAHFTRNEACRPAWGWGADPDLGLTAFGRDLVDELDRLRILVDLAHVNRKGFMEAIARSQAPVIVSHTGVTGVHRHWRNIDDDQIRAVADKGGVVGIIFAPAFLGVPASRGTEGIVAHVRHVIDLVGDDHVAIGSDLDGFIVPPRDLRDVSCLPVLTWRMEEAGLSETAIRKCLGTNMLRVFGEVCG